MSWLSLLDGRDELNNEIQIQPRNTGDSLVCLQVCAIDPKNSSEKQKSICSFCKKLNHSVNECRFQQDSIQRFNLSQGLNPLGQSNKGGGRGSYNYGTNPGGGQNQKNRGGQKRGLGGRGGHQGGPPPKQQKFEQATKN